MSDGRELMKVVPSEALRRLSTLIPKAHGICKINYFNKPLFHTL